MPLNIVRNDITKMHCDAIVNAAKSSLLGGGGVDGAIHKAAGMSLLKKCMTLGGCKVGEAKATKGYKLPCKYIFHTVGPVWQGGNNEEEESLRSCYRSCLELALKYKCESIAFPLISAGHYGYPTESAVNIAVNEINEFLAENEMEVYLVIFDKKAFSISKDLFSDIKSYIDDNYVDFNFIGRSANISNEMYMPDLQCDESIAFDDNASEQYSPKMLSAEPSFSTREICADFDLDIELDLDESFSEMLLRKIDEKGMTDPECYKKANVDRKLFSKIRNDKHYSPRKSTALAFAIALELTLEETEDLLKKAGYALSHSNKFDLIVEYFIKNRKYNIFEINEALYSFDQNLLG